MSVGETNSWKCALCGYIHEGPEPPAECPICGASADQFEPIPEAAKDDENVKPIASGEYLRDWARPDDDFELEFARIQDLAKHGRSEVTPMRTQKSFPAWDTLLFKGAQLFRMPLNEDEPVATKTIIGKTAKQPLELEIPFYVSHMSFGALSREAKIALAKGSNLVGSAICSG